MTSSTTPALSPLIVATAPQSRRTGRRTSRSRTTPSSPPVSTARCQPEEHRHRGLPEQRGAQGAPPGPEGDQGGQQTAAVPAAAPQHRDQEPRAQEREQGDHADEDAAADLIEGAVGAVRGESRRRRTRVWTSRAMLRTCSIVSGSAGSSFANACACSPPSPSRPAARGVRSRAGARVPSGAATAGTSVSTAGTGQSAPSSLWAIRTGVPAAGSRWLGRRSRSGRRRRCRRPALQLRVLSQGGTVADQQRLVQVSSPERG